VLFLFFIVAFLVLWGAFYAALPLLRYGGARLAHRAAGLSMRYPRVKRFATHAGRFRDYLPVTLILVTGALLTAWTGDQFLDIAELVHAKSPLLQQMDANVHGWAVTRRNSGATLFFGIMSVVGGPVGLASILAVVAVALMIARRWRWLIYLTVTAAGGALLDLELKRFFARARPELAEALRTAHGYSFPSGHAMGSTVAFFALSYIAFRVFPQWRWKAAALALATTLVLSVALSRVYLGVHWISDVGAGIVAGLLWVTATTVAYETSRRVRLLRSIRAQRRG
jgi:membrane-associated phospholipid phosphatase